MTKFAHNCRLNLRVFLDIKKQQLQNHKPTRPVLVIAKEHGHKNAYYLFHVFIALQELLNFYRFQIRETKKERKWIDNLNIFNLTLYSIITPFDAFEISLFDG